MIRKESQLADLITGAGLLGSTHSNEAGNNAAANGTSEQLSISRPCSAPASRSSTLSRQLSRANSRAATILGLQSSASRRYRTTSSFGSDSPAKTAFNAVGSTAAQDFCDARSASITRCSSAKSGKLAWQEPSGDADQANHQAIQQLQYQQLLRQLQCLTEQLSAAQKAQQTSEMQLQQQAADHQAALQEQQALHDSSSKKLFRELKAAQAAKEQALAAKRNAEVSTRDAQQELSAVQAKCQQLQQQVAVLDERVVNATRKLEQQAVAHEEASRKAADKAERKLHKLQEQLAANQATIEAAEDALRQELHKRTATILSMQARLEEQDSQLAAAAAHQAELQDRVQALQSQGSYLPSTDPSQASSDEPLIPSNSNTEQQDSTEPPAAHGNRAASCKADTSAMPSCAKSEQPADSPASIGLLNRQLQLHDTAATNTVLSAEAADLGVGLQECRKSHADKPTSCGRPVSASAQTLRQSLGAWQDPTGGSSAAAAVKTLAAQVEVLTASLAAANRDAADAREQYARNLAHLEKTILAAEASAAACWQAYDSTFTTVVQRVSMLLQSQCAGLAVPCHRPKSARNAGSKPPTRPVSGCNNSNPVAGCDAAAASAGSPGRRPASAAVTSSFAATVAFSGETVGAAASPDQPGSQTARSYSPGPRCNADSSSSRRPQSANAAGAAARAATWHAWSEAGGRQQQQFSSRPASAATPRTAAVAAASASNRAGGSSGVHALNVLNHRLCDENAWLLVELGKWEAGHHQKQVALAAAVSQQARSNMVGATISSSSKSFYSGRGATADSAAASGADNVCCNSIESSTQEVQQDVDSSRTTTSTAVDDDDGVRTGGFDPPAAVHAMSSPVRDALTLAVKEALQANKGPLLPSLLLKGLSVVTAGNGSSCSSSSSGWAAVGSSRLAAALSAAEINMNLRAKVLQLESAVAHLKAEHAGDESEAAQQQRRIKQLEKQVQQLVQDLESAKLQAEEANDKAQQCLQVAAAAVAKDAHVNSSARGYSSNAAGAVDSALSTYRESSTLQCSTASIVPGIGADERLTVGLGLLRDLPIAAQQEIAAQRRIAAAAKRDKEARSRDLAQLEMRYSSLAAKLVKSRQAVAHKDAQVMQLQQALAAAHMALLDAGLDCQQSQAPLGAATAAAFSIAETLDGAAPTAADCTRSAGRSKTDDEDQTNHSFQQLESAVNASAGNARSSSAGMQELAGDDVMNLPLSNEESVMSCCSKLSTATSSAASVLGVNAAAAASWSAAMEARDRTKKIQRLNALCADKQAKVDGLQQELKKLQQQLSRQQRAADAALAAAHAEEASKRESLAGDLEGATTAMHDAARKLAASESECIDLRRQLALAQHMQQQLELDVAYLRGRRASAVPVSQQPTSSTTQRRLACVDAFSISITP